MKNICLLFLALAALAAFAFAGCQTIRNTLESDFVKEQLTLILADAKSKLVDRMDAKLSNRQPNNPDAPATNEPLPNFKWSFGAARPAAPVSVWWGKMKSTPNRIELDYTDAPSWFTTFNGRPPTGDENLYECAVFYIDGDEVVGDKFDWANFVRKFRDLKHCNGDMGSDGVIRFYRNWDGRYANRAPDYAVIFDNANRRWLIFTP